MKRQERRDWCREVLATEMTPAQRLVLLALETFADYADGTNARPGVARLAEMCRLQTRVVEAALHEGRRLGLIEQTGRANPKRGLAACYRLVSTRADMRPEGDSTRADMHVESGFNPHGKAFQPARNSVSTRTSMQPTQSVTPTHNTRACSDCHGHGWLLDSSGVPIEPAIRCKHSSRTAGAAP